MALLSFTVLPSGAISRHSEPASTQQTSIQFPMSPTSKGHHRCSGKGKPASVNVQVPAFGSRENLHTRKGVVFRRKNFANPILLPLIGPQEGRD